MGLKLGAGLVGCSVLGALVARGDAAPPAELDLRGGGAWVASSAVGQVTLIDGGTAEVAARVQVAEGTTDLGAVQAGNVGYALDLGQGTVRRVDPATFVAAPPVEVIEGARHQLTLHPSGDLMYVVDHERGKVAVTDSRSLSGLKGEVQSLAEPVSSSVVDGSGRLWTLGDETGDLVWFDGTDRQVRRAVVDDPRATQLVVIDGQPALVDTATRVVRTVGDDGGFRAHSCLDIDPSDRSVRVAGSEGARRLLVVSGDDGVLRVSDLGSGECGEIVIDVADPDSDLGAPQESQGKVFIPNFTTGKVVIVDLETRERTDTGELVAPGTEFELFERDGIVFYNDPGSERAGVVRVDGTFSEVDKYDPDRPGAGVVPEAGRDQAPVPDLDAPGQGAGVDEGALGGPDPGGGPDEVADGPDTEAGDGPAEEAPTELGGDQSAAPVPDSGPAGGQPEPGTPDPGTPDPGTPGPGPTTPAEQIDIRVGQQGADIDEQVRFTAITVDPDATLSDVEWFFDARDPAPERASGNPVMHAFAASGDHIVRAQGTLRTGSGPGETVSVERLFPVLEPSEALVADFDLPPAGTSGQPVTVTNRSTGATRYAWTFTGARRPDSSNQAAPAAPIWDTAGTYTVTLEVQRGSESQRRSRDITISDPLPDRPVVGPITPSSAGPYDTSTTYTFSADLAAGSVMESCEFTIEGRAITCVPAPIGGGATRLSVTHRFTSGGAKTISMAVTNRGGTTRPTALSITVRQLAPPTAVLRVASGADPDGNGGWVTNNEQEITFDASGTTGDYTSLTWRDQATGATASGTQWSVTLAALADPHVITLTATDTRQGVTSTDQVTVTVVSAPPRALPQVTAVAGPNLFSPVGADAFDLFGAPIVRIEVYAHIAGTCVTLTGSSRSYEIDNRTTPLAVGTTPDFSVAPDGTASYRTGLPATCTGSEEFGPVSTFELWAIAENEDGARGESPHLTSL
ncbi:MAG TPA: hypothetical protein VH479_23025 [Acidimicrobiales bacterium]